MTHDDAEVHLVVMIHGLWGGPGHLHAAREELIKAWKENHGHASGSRTKTAVEGDANGRIETTQVESTSTRRRSGRLRQRAAKGRDASDIEGSNEKIEANAEAGSSNGKTQAEEEEEAPDDLVVVIAGGMASTLTYDGVDVNASRVAWEVDEKISELEALGTKVTRFSVLGYSLGGVIARYLVGLLHSRSPSFFEAHRPVSFTTVACPHLGIPAYNSYFSTALIFLGSRLLARTGSQLYVRDRYSDEDPRPLLEIMADPTKVFHKALDQFKHVQVFANGTRDFTVPYPSAAIEDSDPFIEWEAQGLVVESNESGLVESWRYPDDQEALKMTQSKKSGWTNPMDKLPPVLKDRFRYNPALLIVFPIAMPVILVLMIFRLSMDSRRSSNRIALLKTPKSLEGATPNRHGWSIEHLRDTIGRFEQSMETDLIEEADPPGQMRRRSRRSSAPHRPPNGSAKTRPTQMDGPEKLELPSQRVQFTPAQQNMLRGLRRIKIDRFVTWYPDIGNSHAVSICRDPKNKPVHNKGRGLLKVWAESLIRDDAEE